MVIGVNNMSRSKLQPRLRFGNYIFQLSFVCFRSGNSVILVGKAYLVHKNGEILQ